MNCSNCHRNENSSNPQQSLTAEQLELEVAGAAAETDPGPSWAGALLIIGFRVWLPCPVGLWSSPHNMLWIMDVASLHKELRIAQNQ
jgi:hypothetical protein